MTRRPSLIYAICTRFDDLKAIGVSRHAEKQRIRETEVPAGQDARLSVSTGRIHADQTLTTYKGIALRFGHWARATHGVTTLAELDANAPRLVSDYLTARMTAGDSPFTLATTRSGLRMFFRPIYAALPVEARERTVRALGADVVLPPRRRTGIARSRGPVAMDRHLAHERYAALYGFAHATGLRRRELAHVTPADVHHDEHGALVVRVRNGKGGRVRCVPVLAGHQAAVLAVLDGKNADEPLFRVPTRMDCHAVRRAYAQALYTDGNRYPLPPAEGRLPTGSVNGERALYVARALGHNRIDVLVRYYLR